MQHLILVVLFVLIIGLLITVTRWPGGLHMTFSQHAATSRQSKIFYALLFLITLPLLMWFFVEWLVPTKNLPIVFLWFATVAVIFQILCTLIPEDGGVRTVIHRTLTGISGIAMLPLVLILVLSPGISTYATATSCAALLLMMILLSVALKNQKDYPYALTLQVGYYVAFFIAILASTYL